MSIESRSRQYGKVFDHWQIREFLGSGSGGKSAVFRLVHSSASAVNSALKVISLIEKRGDFEDFSEFRKAEYEQAKENCKVCAEQEVLLMNGLQGRTNVVDYLDHTFVDWVDESGFGCDMLIRMELLKDLRSQIEDNYQFSQDEVLKIGRDICNALVLCHRKAILHRDIKPENIFYNDDGNYKLGDFGVSRILSAAPVSKASTGVCTPEYAAPEQVSGQYDIRVDIYSLGLVLYELSNGNLLPFASSTYITAFEVQERMLGKPLPPPKNASEDFAAAILKACAHNPDDRYQTAEEFLAELNYLSGMGMRPTSPGRNTQKATPSSNRNATRYAKGYSPSPRGGRTTVYAAPASDPHNERKEPVQSTPTRPKAMIIAVALLLVVGIGVAIIGGLNAASDNEAIAGIIDEVNALCDAKDYGIAIAKIEDGLDEYPRSDELEEKLDEVIGLQTDFNIAAVIADAEKSASEGEYEAAIATIKTGLSTYPESTSLQSKLNEYSEALAELSLPDQAISSNQESSSDIEFSVNQVLSDAQELSETGQYREAIHILDKAWKETGEQDFFNLAGEYRMEFGISNSSYIAAGKYNSILIKNDGSVMVVGDNEYDELDAKYWSDIVAVTAGDRHIVGLRSNGTVVSAGSNDLGQRKVDGWSDVVAIAAGDVHTIALREDGTLLAAGQLHSPRCDVERLHSLAGDKRIVSIAAGYLHTLALLEDGTVIASGENGDLQCNVESWTDIAAIYAGTDFSLGLKTDGTVVMAGRHNWSVSGWTDIANLAAGDYFAIGITAEGSLLSAGMENAIGPNTPNTISAWSNIVQVSAGNDHFIALCNDGNARAAGKTDKNQISIWDVYAGSYPRG